MVALDYVFFRMDIIMPIIRDASEWYRSSKIEDLDNKQHKND
jgi:hypothetical protein